MGIQPSEMGRLTWWEYQAMLWNWQDRHDPEGANTPTEAPDADAFKRSQQSLAARGLARTVH